MTIEITDDLLNDLKERAEQDHNSIWTVYNPTVILALIKHIEQMEKEQVWLAEQILCCSDGRSTCDYDCSRCFYIDTVEGWIEQAKKETTDGSTDNSRTSE